MAARLHIAIAQINPASGALAANSEAILAARARHPQADLLVTPALALDGLTGDLACNPAFRRALGSRLQELAAITAEGGPALLVGHSNVAGNTLRPAATLLQGGKIAATLSEPAGTINIGAERLAVLSGAPVDATARHYLRHVGAHLLLRMASTPFAAGTPNEAAELVAATGLPCLFVNRGGAADALAFAGASSAINADGNVMARLAGWEEASLGIGWSADSGFAKSAIAAADGADESLWHAMLVALRDYVGRGGFPGVLIGMSGGIDSALTAAVAVDALGADKVWCVALPSRFTSAASTNDAAACAQLLGVRCDSISIVPGVAALDTMLQPHFAGTEPGLAEENIQARLRMVALMALSNKFGHMMLTTDNKSEAAVGYSTLYGDTAGGFGVLGDLWKTDVYRLARWRNANRPRLAKGPAGPVIPEAILSKAPTAELHANQRDDDSLPPYDVLDPVLQALVEDDLSVPDIAAAGIADRATAARVERLLLNAEYKRRQSPITVQLSQHPFAQRNYPIGNAFRSG